MLKMTYNGGKTGERTFKKTIEQIWIAPKKTLFDDN